MKKLSFAVIAALSIFASAQAETLLGKDYVGGSFGYVEPNNAAEEIFNQGYLLAGEYNVGLHEHVDLNLNGAYGWANSSGTLDDLDTTTRYGQADVRLFQCPGGIFNPYVNGGLTWGRTEVGHSFPGQPFTVGDTDTVFNGGVGAEYEISESVLSRLGVNFYDDGDKRLQGFLGYWVAENVLTKVGVDYDIDGDDTVITSLGLAYTLN